MRDKLQQLAAEFRAVSKKTADDHAAQARALATSLSPTDDIAVKALANISDCMSRRYRQWADHLEAATNEMDEASE